MSAMAPRERIAAAVALEPVDRVPVIPKTELFALRYSGVPVSTSIKDPDRFCQTLVTAYDGLGGYDAITIPGQFMNELGFYPMGSASKLPGYQLPDDDLFQMDEREVMSVDDYDLIKEKGWAGYLPHIYPKLGLSSGRRRRAAPHSGSRGPEVQGHPRLGGEGRPGAPRPRLHPVVRAHLVQPVAQDHPHGCPPESGPSLRGGGGHGRGELWRPRPLR